MDRKLSILLVVAAVAQSSLALNTLDSCSLATNTGAFLATIKFAKATELSGYLRSAQVIHTEIMTILAERYGEIYTDPQYAKLRTEIAEKESFTGPKNGVLPNCEAIRGVQPDLDVPAVVRTATEGRWELNKNIFRGIKAALPCSKNRNKSQEIVKFSKLARQAAVDAIRLFYSAMTNGSNTIPDEIRPAIVGVQAKTEAATEAAVADIFEQINILSKAVCDNKTKDAMEVYSAGITAAYKKSCDSFDAEIRHKYSVLLNIGIAQRYNETGTMAGLYAIQYTFM